MKKLLALMPVAALILVPGVARADSIPAGTDNSSVVVAGEGSDFTASPGDLPEDPDSALSTDELPVFDTGSAAGIREKNNIAWPKGDSPHISSTPPKTVSAHGWWIWHKGGDRITKATVEVTLYAKTPGDDRWYWVASGKKTAYAGGGSGNGRATARFKCKDSARTYYKSLVHLDYIDSVTDIGSDVESPVQTMNCGFTVQTLH